MRRLSILLMIGFSVLIGCGDHTEPGHRVSDRTASVKAETAVARYSRQPRLYEAVGTVHAKLESVLSSKLMATLESIHVKEGDMVKKGDILAKLELIQADAGVNQARAGLEETRRARNAAVSEQASAAAGAELARKTYQRYQSLMKKDSVSPQTFEEVKAKYEAAQASLTTAKEMLNVAEQKVEQAKAGLNSASATQTDTEIRAPYNGVITGKYSEEGSLCAPGTPILSMESLEGFLAYITVPEIYLSAVTLGQSLNVSVGGERSEVRGQGSKVRGQRSDQGAEEQFLPITPLTPAPAPAVVQTIVPISDAATRSFLVKISLPDTAYVVSGMFVRVSIPVGENEMILIPQSAVIVQGQLTGIFKVDENRRAGFRLIRTGRNPGDQVEVLSGLKPGEKFVVMPVMGLSDGVSVEEKQ